MISRCTHLRQEGSYAPSWYRCPHRRSSPHRLPLSRINVGTHADTEYPHHNIGIIGKRLLLVNTLSNPNAIGGGRQCRRSRKGLPHHPQK